MNNITMLKLLFITCSLYFNCLLGNAQSSPLSLNDLKGNWKLDLSPQNKEDSNFAMMKIDKIEPNLVEGTFYREGVPIKEGRTNTQSGKIYVALISGDNSGTYNTSFYLENGKIYGTTHSLERDFLAVWVGEKM